MTKTAMPILYYIKNLCYFICKYSVTLVLPISDFMSTFAGGYCLFS